MEKQTVFTQTDIDKMRKELDDANKKQLDAAVLQNERLRQVNDEQESLIETIRKYNEELLARLRMMMGRRTERYY